MRILFVVFLVSIVLPSFGYLPKVIFETVTTYSSIDYRGAPMVDGVNIDGESYDLSEVICEFGPICFFYYRVLKKDKAKKQLSEDAENWLKKNLLPSPVFRKPGASGQGKEAYDFVCEYLKVLSEYRFEVGRLYAEYLENGIDTARLKPVCEEYNKVAGSKLWRKIYASRGQVFERQKPDLLKLMLSYPGRGYYFLQGKEYENSKLTKVVEEAYGCLIDVMLNKCKRDSDNESDAVKKAKKEARMAKRIAKQANETAAAAKAQAEEAERKAQMSGEWSGLGVVPCGDGKVRVFGRGGSAVIRGK